MLQASLNRLLEPQSIAVVGASSDPSRAGGRPLHYLIEGGFAGAIYPVNPRRNQVQGLKAYPSVAAIGAPVDCAVLAVSADATLDAVRDCAAAGVGAAVIFSAGFSEMGAAGERMQADIVAVARDAGMRLLGPNCLGLYHLGSRAFLTMSGLFQEGFPTGGGLGVVSQSGGYAGQLSYVAEKRALGIGAWVTTGNEADVEMAEVLLAYAADPAITCVLAYIEGVKNGPRFVQALSALHQAGKPLIAFKVGASDRGAQAVASHTATMAGSDRVYDALFERYAVIRVQSTEEALDIARALEVGRLPKGTRFAAVSTSGGVGGQIADLAESFGLDLAPPGAGLKATLKEISPLGAHDNPVDVSGQVVNDPTMMGRSLEALAESGEYDIIQVFIGFSAGIPWLAEPYKATLFPAARKAADKTLLATISGPPDLIAAYEAEGFIVFEDPFRAIRAAAALSRLARALARKVPQLALPPADAGPVPDAAGALAALGLRAPREIVVPPDPAAAGRAAETIGGPVALKIVSPDIAHKTEAGGVKLGLTGCESVKTAAEEMLHTVASRVPAARIEGLAVAEMVTDGVECLLGLTPDPVFGPVISVGLGGVLVEVLRDTALCPAPVDRETALRMIDSLHGRRLLDGFRGAPPVDVAALADAVVRLSEFALTHRDRLAGLEINPLLVRDSGCLALDILMEPAP